MTKFYYLILTLITITLSDACASNFDTDTNTDAGKEIYNVVNNKDSIEPSNKFPVKTSRKKINRSIGINLNGIADWSTQYPFLDFMKQARPWISQKTGANWGQGGPLDLDKNGWVRSLKPGHFTATVFVTPDKGNLPYKRYMVRYKGKGEIRYVGAAQIIKKNILPNTDIVKVKDSGGYAFLEIRQTDSSDYIRDITIVPEEYIELYDQGEIFNPDWISVIEDFRAVRFMNWMKIVDSEQQLWNDRPRVSDYSWQPKGVPAEILIELVNKIEADPWINMPHAATDDYIRKFAELVKKNLDPSLKVYVEHSNEVWNWRFKETHYAEAKGLERWGKVTAPYMQWHGKRTAEICDIWKKGVFLDNTTRVHCVMGVHTGWRELRTAALDCPAWVEEGQEPCYKHGIDSISITGYFSGCLDGNAGWKRPNKVETIRSWFSEDDGGLTKAFDQLESARYFQCNNSVDSLIDTYRFWISVAKEKGLAITAYEGGQHITGNGQKIQDDKQFIDFHIALNRDPRMKRLFQKNLQIWKQQGGTLFMHFLDIGKPSKWGSWGAMEYLGQEFAPKMEALKEFNNEVACWWDDCE